MGIIGINKLMFPVKISKMNMMGNAIDGRITHWTSKGEISSAFTEFVNDYYILQKLIKNYKTLVLKDIRAISNIGTMIIKTDNEIGNLWR